MDVCGIISGDASRTPLSPLLVHVVGPYRSIFETSLYERLTVLGSGLRGVGREGWRDGVLVKERKKEEE